MSDTVRKARALRLRDFRHSLPMELLKAREAAMARFRPMLRKHGLTEQQWRVVRALTEYGPLEASDLATRSFLLAPSVSRILQFLEKQGHIKRSPGENDQRKSIVSLTAAGHKLFDVIAPDSEVLYAEIETEIGAEKIEALYEILAEFYETLGNNNN